MAEDFSHWLGRWSPATPIETVRLDRGATTDDGAPRRHHAIIDTQGMIRVASEAGQGSIVASEGPGAAPAGAFSIGVADDGMPPTLAGARFQAAIRAIAVLQDRFDLPVSAIQFVGPWPPGARSRIENAVRACRGESPPADRSAAIKEPEMEPINPGSPGARNAPDDVAALAALRPHLIDLWGGKFSQEGLFHTDEGDVARIFEEDLPRRLAALDAGRRLPIVLYAHGGLVGESAGLKIAANQVAWWNDNGCYPLQFIWETSLLESIEKMIGIQRALARDLSDVTDTVIERAARTLGGPPVWGNMKHSAAAAFEPGAAGTLVIERLVAFARANLDRVRLHAVGHSAGAIFHAHLLQRLDALDAPPLETLTFLAPAITVDDYERLIDPLIPTRAKQLRIFTMKKDYELRDTVTPLYRKSLLYFIRNALESRIGEPVLGLEESVRADPRLIVRLGLGGSASATGSVVWSVTAATTGAEASGSISHGGFDNDVPTMNSVARRILGIPDDTQLPASFPPDTEERSVTGPTTAPSPTFAMPASMPVPPSFASRRTDDQPVRRALCVGINAYPAPNTLAGCVADSESWSAALATLGFSVDKLQDGAATHATILNRLRSMVDESRAGDLLVFQYAGHGTQVPDLDGDEPPVDGHAGQDQAICPVDFATGDLIVDDDLRAILDRLPPGVRLTCFMDNCHSGSNTRLLVGRAPSPGPGSRPRFIKLSQDVVDRFVAKRRLVNRARALAGGRAAAGSREEMRWVSFAACRDDESAWETGGHGDFTRLAVTLLDGRTGLTNSSFQDLVIKDFGPNRRQTPVLDCRDGDASAPFLVGWADGAAGAAGDSGGAATTQADRAPPPAGDRAGDVADLLNAIARLLR